ncbi:MAG: hypothetical protein JNL98_02570 [Bryobacterales bacterium]|nr:hypothetical protein [Bryobacterales bacterium]
MSITLDWKTEIIDLRGKVTGGAGLEFADIEILTDPPGPLATVAYRENGVLQEEVLRIDLGKQVFLDHFEDAEKEAVAVAAAPLIVAYLSEEEDAKAAGLRTQARAAQGSPD